MRTVSSHRLIATTSVFDELLREVKSKFDEERYSLTVDELPAFTDIYLDLDRENTCNEFKPPPLPSKDTYVNGVVLYIHSSGSTGLPKSIPYTWDYISRLSRSREPFPLLIPHAKLDLPLKSVDGGNSQLCTSFSLGLHVFTYVPYHGSLQSTTHAIIYGAYIWPFLTAISSPTSSAKSGEHHRSHRKYTV